MWRGRILDGRNRYAACEKAGVKPAFVNYAGKDPQGYALAVNKHRRHMRPSALQLITEEVRRLMVGKQSHITQTKRKAIAIMRRSCSDSLLTASQVDGVFGSDTHSMPRRPAMQEYRNDKIVVRYDPKICIHAGECVRGLPIRN
jgi:hypothetical protein